MIYSSNVNSYILVYHKIGRGTSFGKFGNEETQTMSKYRKLQELGMSKNMGMREEATIRKLWDMEVVVGRNVRVRLVISFEKKDVVWLPIRQLSTRYQMTQELTYIGHRDSSHFVPWPFRTAAISYQNLTFRTQICHFVPYINHFVPTIISSSYPVGQCIFHFVPHNYFISWLLCF